MTLIAVCRPTPGVVLMHRSSFHTVMHDCKKRVNYVTAVGYCVLAIREIIKF